MPSDGTWIGVSRNTSTATQWLTELKAKADHAAGQAQIRNLERRGSISVDHRSYDQTNMVAQGFTCIGRAIDVKLTYAFGHGLSAYNATDDHWIPSDQWEWTNL